MGKQQGSNGQTTGQQRKKVAPRLRSGQASDPSLNTLAVNEWQVGREKPKLQRREPHPPVFRKC